MADVRLTKEDLSTVWIRPKGFPKSMEAMEDPENKPELVTYLRLDRLREVVKEIKDRAYPSCNREAACDVEAIDELLGGVL